MNTFNPSSYCNLHTVVGVALVNFSEYIEFVMFQFISNFGLLLHFYYITYVQYCIHYIHLVIIIITTTAVYLLINLVPTNQSYPTAASLYGKMH